MTETRWVPKVGDTVWVSRYALSDPGVIPAIVRSVEDNGDAWLERIVSVGRANLIDPDRFGHYCFRPEEYHPTEREAAARALLMAEEELEAAWAMIDELEKARDRYAAMAR